MLFLGAAIKRVGRVDVGDTITDHLPQERERGITIQSAVVSMHWKDCLINLIDTPGHVDFTMEVEGALRVLDGTVVVIDAVSGVQAQTRTVWNQSQNRLTPSIAFVNKMDRIGASFEDSLESLRSKLNMKACPIQMPVGNEDKFSGIIDLITFTKMIWEKGTPPAILNVSEDDELYETAFQARTELIEAIAEYDNRMLELYLQNPDMITEKDLLFSLRELCINESFVPVLCGASLQGKGIHHLLDAIRAFLPSPLERKHENLILAEANKYSPSPYTDRKKLTPTSEEFCALVFKTVHDNTRGSIAYARIFSGVLECKSVVLNTMRSIKERVNQLCLVNADGLKRVDKLEAGQVCCIIGLKHTRSGDTLVGEKGSLRAYRLDGPRLPKSLYSLSIEPQQESQQVQLEECLHVLCMEDPSLSFEFDGESAQTILRGIGELHLEVACDKIRRQFGIEVSTGKAYVAYRESVGVGMKIDSSYCYDKEIGTKRLYAGLRYIISCTKGKDIEEDVNIHVANSVKASLSNDELVALIQGLNSAILRGPCGYPLVGFEVSIIDAWKDKDSTPGAFQACAFTVVHSCLRDTCHVLLEPIGITDIEVPSKFLGTALSDFTVKRRGIVREIENKTDEMCIIRGLVPMSEMLSYASSIRSITQGSGIFSLQYSHLAVVEGFRRNSLS